MEIGLRIIGLVMKEWEEKGCEDGRTKELHRMEASMQFVLRRSTAEK